MKWLLRSVAFCLSYIVLLLVLPTTAFGMHASQSPWPILGDSPSYPSVHQAPDDPRIIGTWILDKPIASTSLINEYYADKRLYFILKIALYENGLGDFAVHSLIDGKRGLPYGVAHIAYSATNNRLDLGGVCPVGDYCHLCEEGGHPYRLTDAVLELDYFDIKGKLKTFRFKRDRRVPFTTTVVDDFGELEENTVEHTPHEGFRIGQEVRVVDLDQMSYSYWDSLILDGDKVVRIHSAVLHLMDKISSIQKRDAELLANIQCHRGVVHCINSSFVSGKDTRYSFIDDSGDKLDEIIPYPASIIDPNESTYCSSCMAKIKGTYNNWDRGNHKYNSVNCVWFTRAKLSYLLDNAFDANPPPSRMDDGDKLIVRGLPLYTAHVFKNIKSWKSLFEGLDKEKGIILGIFEDIGGIAPDDILIFQTTGHTFLIDYFDGEYFYFTDNKQATQELLMSQKDGREPNQIEVRKWTAKEVIDQYKHMTLDRVTVLKYKMPESYGYVWIED